MKYETVMKRLDPNAKMKPSGVEWIEEIPKNWEVLKVKHVGYSNPSKNNPKTACLKDTLVVFLPMERVHTDGTIDQELRLPYSQLKNGYTYFEENDVLIAKVTPCFENGKIILIKNLATTVGFGSTEFIVIRPNLQKVFPRFLFYLLYNEPLRSIGKHFMTSAVGLKRVPTEFVENFQIPIPSDQEQHQIANFLDRKTGQIDELIRIKERRIALLQEQRTVLINQAVTKGLDPNVEMKPSGVGWIGEIPVHWEIGRIKHIATFVSEKSIPETDTIKISPENVESGTGKILDFHSSYDSVGVKFQAGDVLFNKLRVYLSKVVFAKYGGCSLGEMIVIKPFLQRMGKYLFYLMLSSRFIEYCNAISYGVKMPRTAVDDILDAQIPMTSDQEQAQITNFLDRKTQQIDELISTEQRKIELLKEYRQSLISEAVTGKIDVRNEV